MTTLQEQSNTGADENTNIDQYVNINHFRKFTTIELSKNEISTQCYIVKLGKEYKRIKLNFINCFQNYLECKSDSKLIKLTQNITLKLFKYLEIFMLNDLEDLVNIIFKRNKRDIYTKMDIYCYVENIFNSKLYEVLIEKSLKLRYKALLENTEFLKTQPENFIEQYLSKNCTMYVSIIRTEIFKILILRTLMAVKLVNANNNDLNAEIVYQTLISSVIDLINIAKKNIIYYYNDLKTNFKMCQVHINDCKDMIISNNILK